MATFFQRIFGGRRAPAQMDNIPNAPRNRPGDFSPTLWGGGPAIVRAPVPQTFAGQHSAGDVMPASVSGVTHPPEGLHSMYLRESPADSLRGIF